MHALEICNLTKNYDGFRLEGLNLTLPSGYIMGLIGENGAGKSTTIKLILDMIHRDGGRIFLWGQENREAMPLLKQDIGVVLDDVGIPECLAAAQVGKIMARTFSRWDGALYDRYLQMLSLPLTKPFRAFSRGMKKKLGLAVALSHHPKLLLLDEAMSGMDPIVRDQVLEILNGFTREESHAVLISSHIVSDLEKICDYVVFLHKGKRLLWGEKDALLEQYGWLSCSQEQLAAVEPSAIRGKKISPYGVQALVLRDRIPAGMRVSRVDLEELFIYLVKEAPDDGRVAAEGFLYDGQIL